MSHSNSHTRLRTFSVIGDVYFTLFALKSPKTLLGIKRIVSLLKILSWKPSFAKESGRLTRDFRLLMSHNNSHASLNFFSHWRCLLYFICLEIPQNFARNKKNCIFAKDLILKAEFRKKIWLIDTRLHTQAMSHSNSHASSNFFSHWRCLLYKNTRLIKVLQDCWGHVHICVQVQEIKKKNFNKTLLRIKIIVSLIKILSWKLCRTRLRTFSVIGDVYFTLFALKSPKTLLGIKKNCIFAKDLILKAEFRKKNLADWHEFSRCWCHTVTRSRLRTFSVIGDVYFTLFALKSAKTLLGIKKNCIFAKDLILKAEFRKKIWLIDTSLQTVDVTQ